MKKIVITGSGGFIGGSLVQLLNPQYEIVCMDRCALSNEENWGDYFVGASCLVHCAGLAHIRPGEQTVSLEDYRKANTDLTFRLAQAATRFKVKRFIFLSSILVNGTKTEIAKPFKYDDIVSPQTDFALSKSEAEFGLRAISKSESLEVVILRLPLVYGPGVKANFLSLMNLAEKNLPLPLGSIRNERSLISISNLVELIRLCIEREAASGNTFLVSDDNDVSTTELLESLTRASGKKPRLIACPPKLIKLVAKLVGKEGIADRLMDSLKVDITYTKKTLDWEPSLSFQKSIQECYDKTR